MDKPPLQNHRAESKLTVSNDCFSYTTNAQIGSLLCMLGNSSCF